MSSSLLSFLRVGTTIGRHLAKGEEEEEDEEEEDLEEEGTAETT